MPKSISALLLSASILLSQQSISCSAFIFNQDKSTITAVNIDWPQREGVITIHPRHITKVSQVDGSFTHPATWTSQYGSVVMHGGNSRHITVSADGINEMGLTASTLMLKSSIYPDNPDDTTLASTDWVEYILDNFKSVHDVIEHSHDIQITAVNYENLSMKQHLLVTDSSGDVAILEYLDKKLIVHPKESISSYVLTNEPYDAAVDVLSDYKEFGGTKSLPGEYDSLSRFIRGASFLHRLNKPIPFDEKVAYAFHALDDVAKPPQTPSPTEASIVFDLQDLQITFKTTNNPWLRTIRLKDIDFDNLTATKVLDAYTQFSGNVLPYFKVYTQDINNKVLL